jgi:uncharacterized protein (DUF2126 family)/transglutaminase-like putative cysteine protease
MTIRVALHHRTRYAFAGPTTLGPHEIRLRPTPYCRTPIVSYSLRVEPDAHLLHWQQDVYGNHVARVLFPEPATELVITVDLVADLSVTNPFDFLVEPYAERYPFRYPEALRAELAPYLATDPAGPLLEKWLAGFHAGGYDAGESTVGFLVNLNQRVGREIEYLVRVEPGVQMPEDTLSLGSGSCRDSAWLLAQILRHLGLATRFVSGYLIQLAGDADVAADGPESDGADLHAWVEVYLPGAGWIGLDPTSGLLTGEGHIPVACSANTASAAPVIGTLSGPGSRLEFEVSVSRLREDPRTTSPYAETDWNDIDKLGQSVDEALLALDVRLTHGGEPTFVSLDDVDGAAWNHAALSPDKWQLAQRLMWRLRDRFARGGVVFYGQGKWYPGESSPRWALGLYWRKDGLPVWRDPGLIAGDAVAAPATLERARGFAARLAERLGVDPTCVMTAYEDPLAALREEAALPINFDPLGPQRGDDAQRARLVKLLARGLDRPVGIVLPLRARQRPDWHDASSEWQTSRWPLRRGELYLHPGDAPIGARLPLASLPDPAPGEIDFEFERDPYDAREALHDAHLAAERGRHAKPGEATGKVVRTALCVEVREDRLHLFLPPLTRLEDFLNLVAAIELVAAEQTFPVRLEGYGPPADRRLAALQITPDPGVIEVNAHPAHSWDELVSITHGVYEDARQLRLGAEKFLPDGRHVGTGGGSHITLGGAAPADSPFLRRPDLLASLLVYWQNHPALSYLFAGRFVGPTSQAPRVDEAREDNLYELEIALQELAAACPPGTESARPWITDRLLRNFLVDLTGNAHRSEFCIDKLYSPASATGRLGLVELRGFEMPPHPRMSLVQGLLVRALVARFWKAPYAGSLARWGTQLHDRWMLPHFLEQDIRDVAGDLRRAGWQFRDTWLEPFLEFRLAHIGAVAYQGVRLELRQAIEPWNVLGEEMGHGGTSRIVDSSVERLQVKVQGMTGERHVVTCNGRPLPLHPTGVKAEFVAGVRFKAFDPPSARHPTIGVQAPLVFDLVDAWSGRSLGGCTVHVSNPGARPATSRPVNANEAEARRAARFWPHGHTPGPMAVKPELPNREFPYTLDLRRRPG